MKRLIANFSILFLLSCSNNEPKPEQPISYARSVTGATKFGVRQANGDSIVVTYTPSSYTASKLDTVWIIKGGVVVVPPDTVIVTPPPVTGYSVFYENGFDKTGDLDPQGHEQFGLGYIDNAFYKTAPASFHSLPDSKSSGIRSEVQFNTGFVPHEAAVEYDVYYKKMAANNAHSFQLHPGTGGASACPGLWHRNSSIYITFKLPSSTPEKFVFKPVLNRWYNIRHEFKMSTGNDGYWRVYVDGVLMASYNGRTAYDMNWWLKIGVNMWSQSASNSDVYYDNLKIYKK